MPLEQCKSLHSHRQMRDWITWLDSQMNEPSRSDYYVMQLTMWLAKIYSLLSSTPFNPNLDSYKLNPETDQTPAQPSLQERAEASKRAAFAAMNLGPDGKKR